MVITTSDRCGELAQAVGRVAADLLDEVVGDLAAAVVDVDGEAGAHQAGRHRPAHVADADEADRLALRVGHYSAAFDAPSISLNTSITVLNASRQAGMPQ